MRAAATGWGGWRAGGRLECRPERPVSGAAAQFLEVARAAAFPLSAAVSGCRVGWVVAVLPEPALQARADGFWI